MYNLYQNGNMYQTPYNASYGGFMPSQGNYTGQAPFAPQNGIQNAICQLGYEQQNCCCQTQRAIDGVNYNMAKNTCDITNAIHTSTRDIIDAQRDGTNAILNFLTQDKIATLQAENQSLKFQASQTAQNAFIAANQEAQTAELIRRLGRDCPVPAYVVPNPNCCYTPNFTAYNSGCGCNNGCGC